MVPCEFCSESEHATQDEADECERNYWDWYDEHQYDDVDFEEE